MGGAQSVPHGSRKGILPTDERAALVESSPAATNDHPGAGDVTGDTSPRAVSRFAPNPSPLRPTAFRSNSDSSVAHTDISALPLSAGTPTSASVVELGQSTASTGNFRILVLMSETGGGHRASAQALEAAFEQLYPGSTDITTVDFWTSVAGFPFHRFPQQYTYLAKRPLLWKFFYQWAAFAPTRWLTESAFSLFCFGKVRRYFERAEPDLIVSVHPLVNTLSLAVLDYMRDLHDRPMPPYVTVVTDLGGAHPTWFDARSELVYVPSDPLREMALSKGLARDQIRLLGLPIRPSFWTETRSRGELRHELGMAQDIPAVLLVGGGDGVGGLSAIASAIAKRICDKVGGSGGQLVVVCGKNRRLLGELQARSWPIPVVLKGFVNNMSEWMSACDILCSKAGPGTIAEAWIRGLPIILTGFLPGQEEGNVQLVTDSGSGEFHAEPDAIADCAARWVGDPEERSAVATCARNLGRPNSSCQIASDIWTVGQARLKDREAFHRRRALQPAQGVPNGYIAMTRFYVVNMFRSVRRSMPSLFGYTHPELIRGRE